MDRITSLLKEFCENTEDCKYHSEYSGRGMFGKRCVGIIVEGNVLQEVVKLCDYLHKHDVDNVEDALGAICIDSFGMGKIIYFPKITPAC